MSWKMQRVGFLLMALGGLSFVLPYLGLQLRILQFTDDPKSAALILIGLGAVLAVLGTLGLAGKKASAQPPPPALPPGRCGKCGANLAPGTAFCTSCGQAVPK
jgi:hypothetical protein